MRGCHLPPCLSASLSTEGCYGCEAHAAGQALLLCPEKGPPLSLVMPVHALSSAGSGYGHLSWSPRVQGMQESLLWFQLGRNYSGQTHWF